MILRTLSTAVCAAVVGALAAAGCSGVTDPRSNGGAIPVGSVLVGDAAISVNAGGVDGISLETRFEIVAAQLEPEPTVVVSGADVRLVFDGGEVENAFIDCVVADVARLDTDTVTLVYPDGEARC